MDLSRLIKGIDQSLLLEKDYYFDGLLLSSGIIEGSSFFQELLSRVENKIIPKVYHNKDIRRFVFTSDVRDCLDVKDYSNLEVQGVFESLYDLNLNTKNLLLSKVFDSLNLNLLKVEYHLNSSKFHVKNLSHPNKIFNFQEVKKHFFNYQNDTSIKNFKSLNKVLTQELFRLRKSKFLQNTGISFDLSFRYLISEDLIKRFMSLLSFHYYLKSKFFSDDLYSFFEELRLEITSSKSVFSLVSDYWSILNYEATEYSARLGQKYSSSSVSSILSIFISSLIGGSVVGFLAFLKPLLSFQLENYAFMKYMSHGILYSIIFISIYFLKGTLATKQPSKIICSILNILDNEEDSEHSMKEVAGYLRMSFMNQLFCVFGNIIAGGVCSYLILIVFKLNGISLFSKDILINEFHSLNILTSRSIYYACIAGVWLVLAGIFGGLVDNWYKEKNFHLIKERDFNVFTKQISSFLSHHIGQISSSIFLAFTLAFSPYFGDILGLDLSIRHVTFASTQVPYILFTSANVDLNLLLPILLGVIGIGVFNVLVGYSLTFYMLFKSREMNSNRMKKLFYKVLLK